MFVWEIPSRSPVSEKYPDQHGTNNNTSLKLSFFPIMVPDFNPAGHLKLVYTILKKHLLLQFSLKLTMKKVCVCVSFLNHGGNNTDRLKKTTSAITVTVWQVKVQQWQGLGGMSVGV